MTRTRRDWRETGRYYCPEQRAEDARICEDRWARIADGWGISGLVDGFALYGWTLDDLCWVIDHDVRSGRCEFGALSQEGQRLGLVGLGPDALRAAADADRALRAERRSPHRPEPVFFRQHPPFTQGVRERYEAFLRRRDAKARRRIRGPKTRT